MHVCDEFRFKRSTWSQSEKYFDILHFSFVRHAQGAPWHSLLYNMMMLVIAELIAVGLSSVHTAPVTFGTVHIWCMITVTETAASKCTSVCVNGKLTRLVSPFQATASGLACSRVRDDCAVLKYSKVLSSRLLQPTHAAVALDCRVNAAHYTVHDTTLPNSLLIL